MKVVIVLTALVAIASSSSIQEISSDRSLKDDIEEFIELLPLDELTDLVIRFLITDKEFQQAIFYLHGEEFSAIWNQFFALKEIKEVLNYLEDAGLEVYELLNEIADFLGLNHVTPVHGFESLRADGLTGFFDEFAALLPFKELKDLYEDKLNSSAEFKAFIDKLSSFEFQKLVDFYENSKEAQAMFQKLRDRGVDVDRFFEQVAGFFGSNF